MLSYCKDCLIFKIICIYFFVLTLKAFDALYSKLFLLKHFSTLVYWFTHFFLFLGISLFPFSEMHKNINKLKFSLWINTTLIHFTSEKTIFSSFLTIDHSLGSPNKVWSRVKSFLCCDCLQELLQLEDRLGSVSRGAVQTTIERFTFPHKYKKVNTHKHTLTTTMAVLF